MRVGLFAAAMFLSTACCAQKAIGTVSPADANVATAAGAPTLQLVGGRQVLIGSATVTAKDHSAPIALERGGEAVACLGTAVHLSESPDESLLFGLDRGAMEIRTTAKAGDVVMTPDLRFTMGQPAPLDLRMRVTSAGDTCVDNRGHRAPTLNISDAFGETSYQLKPGQHVTFEHGSLREVVDKENVPCGCPPDDLKSGSLADAALSGGGSGKPMTPAEKSAAEHPFPEAVSEGLVPPSPAPPQPAQVTHVEVSASLTYDPTASTSAPAAAIPATVQAAPPQKHVGGPFSAIGRFFKRLFAR